MSNPESDADAYYHGTYRSRADNSVQPDGSYRYPDGEPIWLADDPRIPRQRAQFLATMRGCAPVLLKISASDLVLIRTPRLGSEMDAPDYFLASELPSGSFQILSFE